MLFNVIVFCKRLNLPHEAHHLIHGNDILGFAEILPEKRCWLSFTLAHIVVNVYKLILVSKSEEYVNNQ